jgi:sugar lactone lactonase YvrE
VCRIRAVAGRSSDRGALAALIVGSDGACLDAEGAVWITGARVVRVVEGGTVTAELRLRMLAYACALGGADGRTLFACIAPDFDEAARKAAREAELVAITVDVAAPK